MKRIRVYVAAVLTLGAFACDRHEDSVGVTNTTSATMDPVDRSNVAQPPGPFVAEEEQVATPRLIHPKNTGANPGTGIGTGTATAASPSMNDNSMQNTGNFLPEPNADPSFGGVAPGHIMFPPGSAKGTGEPNTNGSHSLGTGNGTPR